MGGGLVSYRWRLTGAIRYYSDCTAPVGFTKTGGAPPRVIRSLGHPGATKAGDRHLDSPVLSFLSIFFRFIPFFLIVLRQITIVQRKIERDVARIPAKYHLRPKTGKCASRVEKGARECVRVTILSSRGGTERRRRLVRREWNALGQK